MRQGQSHNRQRSRGRGNQNRNNNNRNQLNRSMESNGPDVRIRGTAAHIAEKYTTLAHDAQTSGDTVAAQSYWQHAEHYNRLIATAQAAQAEEQAKRDEERAKRDAERQQNRGNDGNDDNDSDGDDDRGRNRGRGRRNRNQDDREDIAAKDDNDRNDDQGDDQPQKKKKVKAKDGDDDRKSDDKAGAPQPDVDGVPAEVALKEGPASNGEDAPKPRRATRPRKPKDTAITEDAAELPAFVAGD